MADHEGVVTQIVNLARERLCVERVWLFGSRARGDHHARSDIDLALLVPQSAKAKWGTFVAEVEQEARTLLDLDLVDIERCDTHLRDEILRDGRVIYERDR